MDFIKVTCVKFTHLQNRQGIHNKVLKKCGRIFLPAFELSEIILKMNSLYCALVNFKT